MAEEKKPEVKKKPSNKGKTPPINTNIIFFSILVIGIIIFTVILLLKPNVTVYRAQLAQNAECIVQVSKKDLDIGIKVDGEVVSQQHGTYTERILEEGETASDTATEYIITFDNETDEASMVIEGNELTLYLSDDTVIVCIADETTDSTTTTSDIFTIGDETNG